MENKNIEALLRHYMQCSLCIQNSRDSLRVLSRVIIVTMYIFRQVRGNSSKNYSIDTTSMQLLCSQHQYTFAFNNIFVIEQRNLMLRKMAKFTWKINSGHVS